MNVRSKLGLVSVGAVVLASTAAGVGTASGAQAPTDAGTVKAGTTIGLSTDHRFALLPVEYSCNPAKISKDAIRIDLYVEITQAGNGLPSTDPHSTIRFGHATQDPVTCDNHQHQVDIGVPSSDGKGLISSFTPGQAGVRVDLGVAYNGKSNYSDPSLLAQDTETGHLVAGNSTAADKAQKAKDLARLDMIRRYCTERAAAGKTPVNACKKLAAIEQELAKEPA